MRPYGYSKRSSEHVYIKMKSSRTFNNSLQMRKVRIGGWSISEETVKLMMYKRI